MASPIHHMSVIQCFTDKRPWKVAEIATPTWHQVEAAVRQMDNICFPVVHLNTTEHDDDESTFCVVGGAGRFALTHMTGRWQYDDPSGANGEAVLWENEEGYFCRERNVLNDIEKVLRITKMYYDTGSYENLDNVK